MKLYYHSIFILITSFFILMSCSDMNELHDHYLKNGEIIYTGRVDSAEILPGKNRLILRYWNSDPKAKKLLVYWSFRTDSLVVDIPVKDVNDSVDIVISNLEEGNINFELFTMNEQSKNRSVAYNLSGNVYGDKYLSTLRSRAIRTTLNEPLIGSIIYWSSSMQNSIGDKLVYKNSTGQEKNLLISPSNNKTMIEDVSGDITWQTAYLPTKNSIDTFYTEVRTIDFNNTSGASGVPRLIEASVTQEGNKLQFFVFVEGANVEKCSFLLRSVGKNVIGANEHFFQSGNYWYLNGGTPQSTNLSILQNHPLNEASSRGVFIHNFDTSNWQSGTYTFEYGWHNRPGMGGSYIMFLTKNVVEIKTNQ
ncbi:MAG: DUF4998 domain-containing protein [Petrimonas sp.]|jgi:hypothetical protein|nr:DUF4998 domain-containing protein [Petrimonas sp.]